MKTRNGFVSNSSSSSFILKGNITADAFIWDVKSIWRNLVADGEMKDEGYGALGNWYENTNALTVKDLPRKEASKVITHLYNEEYWGANKPIHETRYYGKNKFIQLFYFIINKFRKTYLQEALEADVFLITGENYIPYPVIDALLEKYGKNLTVHHLG